MSSRHTPAEVDAYLRQLLAQAPPPTTLDDVDPQWREKYEHHHPKGGAVSELFYAWLPKKKIVAIWPNVIEWKPASLQQKGVGPDAQIFLRRTPPEWDYVETWWSPRVIMLHYRELHQLLHDDWRTEASEAHLRRLAEYLGDKLPFRATSTLELDTDDRD